MTLDIEHLRQWIGRTEILHDVATPVPLQALAATLDRDDMVTGPATDPVTVLVTDPVKDPGHEVPPCWHWLYFLPLHRQSGLGTDGHARRGGFLPPAPLPRRMWAGSRLEFLAPLRTGQAIRRHSRIADVRLKAGRSGPLVFVQVHHDIHAEGRHAIHEEHDIVYRDMPEPGEPMPAAMPAPLDALWRREIRPDDVLLFRYSALTFNGHRIHYDRRYVTEVEGYPGLVVHGPLIATLLLDLLHRQRPAAQVRRFAFKTMQPIFDTAPFSICGGLEEDKTVRLWAVTPEGHLAMDARAELV